MASAKIVVFACGHTWLDIDRRLEQTRKIINQVANPQAGLLSMLDYQDTVVFS